MKSQLIFCVIASLFSATLAGPSAGAKARAVEKALKSGEGFSLLGTFSDNTRGSGYYLINKQKVSWNTALKVCESQGFNLVSIETSDLDRDLMGFLSSAETPYTNVWTSGNDAGTNGVYNWRYPEAPKDRAFEFTNWRNGVVPKKPDCTCVAINAVKQDGCATCAGVYAWDEEPCNLLKQFVCEI